MQHSLTSDGINDANFDSIQHVNALHVYSQTWKCNAYEFWNPLPSEVNLRLREMELIFTNIQSKWLEFLNYIHFVFQRLSAFIKNCERIHFITQLINNK